MAGGHFQPETLLSVIDECDAQMTPQAVIDYCDAQMLSAMALRARDVCQRLRPGDRVAFCGPQGPVLSDLGVVLDEGGSLIVVFDRSIDDDELRDVDDVDAATGELAGCEARVERIGTASAELQVAAQLWCIGGAAAALARTPALCGPRASEGAGR